MAGGIVKTDVDQLRDMLYLSKTLLATRKTESTYIQSNQWKFTILSRKGDINKLTTRVPGTNGLNRVPA